MKITIIVARALFIICIPFLLFTAAIAGLVNSSWFYTHGFDKYNVRQSLADSGTNLSEADMTQIAHSFIRYFDNGDEFVSIPVKPDLFNTDEILHFRDVKSLFRLDYVVLLGTFLYCLLFSLANIFLLQGANRRKLAGDIIKGGALTLGLMLLLGIGTLINFDRLFYDLHLLIFTNNFWSVEGNMLLLFPDGFWYDGAIYTVISISVMALVLGGISWSYLTGSLKKIQG
jgi:integral membrane protein (TIGR01906 family)